MKIHECITIKEAVYALDVTIREARYSWHESQPNVKRYKNALSDPKTHHMLFGTERVMEMFSFD